MKVPFSGMYTAHLPRPNNKHRLKRFRKFIGWNTVPEGLNVLDVGAKNFIGEQLGIKDYTKGDLNESFNCRLKEYDVITCFEVLNHTMNHLFLVQNINKHLRVGGKLYLSTPKSWLIAWSHGRGNYAELKERSVRILLEYAGFEITKFEVRNPWMWWFIFCGFRPPFRFLFNRYMLIECVKK